jgi:hypothetical protein
MATTPRSMRGQQAAGARMMEMNCSSAAGATVHLGPGQAGLQCCVAPLGEWMIEHGARSLFGGAVPLD